MGSERALVDVLTRTLSRGSRSGVVLDVGDDAAVIARPRGDLVVSVDASVEGVHFRRSWASLDVLGARAFEAALSDLAAMGSTPVGAVLALAMPADVSRSEVGALARGVARAARRARCPVVGGNVTRASEWSITTTVLGTGRRVLTRGGARPGDDVWVTGPLGGAALGLALLERGDASADGARFVRRLLAPRARIATGLALHGIARACIDLSDGLAGDLDHVARASGVSIEVHAERVPRAPGLDRVAARLGLDGRSLAITGGEDYELAFTAAPGARVPRGARCIGRVLRGRPRLRVHGLGGAASGFDHFRHFRAPVRQSR